MIAFWFTFGFAVVSALVMAVFGRPNMARHRKGGNR